MSGARLARKARMLRWLLNLYPPYLGAGVWIQYIAPDLRQVRVEMHLRWYNRNYVGTQFGGSLYSMTDPFYMLMVMENLGTDYIVWDKAARIDFVAPGRGRVHALFAIDDALLQDIREKTAQGDKYLCELEADVRDDDDALVARVNKTLYIRLKPHIRPQATA